MRLRRISIHMHPAPLWLVMSRVEGWAVAFYADKVGQNIQWQSWWGAYADQVVHHEGITGHLGPKPMAKVTYFGTRKSPVPREQKPPVSIPFRCT